MKAVGRLVDLFPGFGQAWNHIEVLVQIDELLVHEIEELAGRCLTVGLDIHARRFRLDTPNDGAAGIILSDAGTYEQSQRHD